MSIFIGDGAIGYNSINGDSTGNILRFLQSARHTPRVQQGLEHSLQTRKRIVIQLDSYGDGSNRGWHNDQNLINFTEETIDYVIGRANAHGISYKNLKKFCRFTFDNEGDEVYPNPADYCHYLNVFADQMASRFEIGAGNLNGHRTDYYNYILLHSGDRIQWLDFHMQKDFETASKTDTNIGYYHNKAIQYGKKLACTEANPTSNNIWTGGYGLLHHQLVKAIEVNCKEFYFVFIQQPMDNNHGKISFILNDGRINPHWSSFRQIIQDNKPIIPIPPIEEEDDMEYVIIEYGKQGGQVRHLQEMLMLEYGFPNDYKDPFDGVFGGFTANQVKAYQKANGLLEDGRVGIDTTLDLLFDVDEKPIEDRYKSTNYWQNRLDTMCRFWKVTNW